MRQIEKDILTVEEGVICHQVNCRKVMGAGLAAAIRKKWPKVYKEYMNTEPSIGVVHVVQVDDKLFVANLYAQNFYGRGKQHTDYDALRECLKTLRRSFDLGQIYLPYQIGCGLGGGDWEVVKSIMEKDTPDAIICKIH